MKRFTKDELPLSLFSACLITSSAIAIGLATLWLMKTPCPFFYFWLSSTLLVTLVGFGFSFSHLGRKTKSVYAVSGISHSWLSREILLGNAFLVMCLVLFVLVPTHSDRPFMDFLFMLYALLGVACLLSVGKVYQLQALIAGSHFSHVWNPAITGFLLAGTLVWLNTSLSIWMLISIWIVDLFLMVIRFRMVRKNRTNPLRVFPSLYVAFEFLSNARLIISLFGIPISYFAQEALIPEVVLLIILDRLVFYGTALKCSTTAEVAQLRQRIFSEMK